MDMKANSVPFCPSCGFALISVLALVSLAALTATAFLASARLERQATRPIGETVRLQMTLNAARECATQTLSDVAGKRWNFVTTYWRTNIADEIGYPFSGYVKDASKISWIYIAGFTPATWTNLSTNVIGTNVSFTNLFCQGSFLTDISNFMTSATNGFTANPSPTNKICTTISLLGGQISPPIGWVYINQDIRTNPALTNTASLPAARFAYFIQDLAGLIDAERMGGTNSRPTGTNAEEISLINLVGTSATNLNLDTYTNKRPQYLTPGMLLSANGGILTNTNDLRYFASRLRYCHWTTNSGNWDRIPFVPISSTSPFYPTNRASRKRNLNTNLDATTGFANIVATITNNFPNFTNRAGGMNGTNYALALAANIIDYADADPTATGSTVGYDNYPLPVVFSDRIALNGANPLTNTANLAAATITVTTYVQLWNCSTLTSPAVTYSLVNNFQDVLLRSNGSSFPSNQIFTNRLTNSLVVPALPPNAVVILAVTNSTTVGPRAGIPGGLAVTTNTLTINHPNGNSYTNFADLFELSFGGKIISQHKCSYTRIGQKITNGSWDWEGTALLMSRTNNPNLAPIGDPRMLRFQSNPVAIPLAYRSSQSGSLRWGGYPYYKPQGGVWNGHPDNWPDGRTSTPAPASGTGQSGGAGGSLPVDVGTPITNLPGTAPAILTTNGKFLTITELGNVFDPIQWKPPNTFTANPRYYNCNIDSTWTNTGAQLHGGGTTLRIGRAEHPRFAFTNLGGTYPVPSLGTSAAGLLDIFCTTNTYNWAGRINLNTAPPAVLAALAGGINLTRDPNKTGTEVNATIINAFTNGVMRFRQIYPFITPSQLAFIATDYGITNPTTSHWTNTWPKNAVFSTSVRGGLNGVSGINDQGFEEWFSKIYNLTCVQSFNYRIYVVAQLTDTNGNPKGAMMRKYYQVHLRNNSMNGSGDTAAQSISPVVTYEALY